MIPYAYMNFRRCVKCNSMSVEAFDKLGRKAKSSYYALAKFKCKACGAVYYMKWVEDQSSGGRIPICADKEEVDNFTDAIIKFTNDKRRKI